MDGDFFTSVRPFMQQMQLCMLPCHQASEAACPACGTSVHAHRKVREILSVNLLHEELLLCTLSSHLAVKPLG